MPYVCGFAIFGAFFLIASLGPEAVWRFFIVLIVISFLYLVYGVHAAQSHDNDLDDARTCAIPDQTLFDQLMWCADMSSRGQLPTGNSTLAELTHSRHHRPLPPINAGLAGGYTGMV